MGFGLNPNLAISLKPTTISVVSNLVLGTGLYNHPSISFFEFSCDLRCCLMGFVV